MVPRARLSEKLISVGGLPPLAQEVKELDAFAQPPLHHLRTTDHLVDDRRDLAGAEIKASVKLLNRIEYDGVGQMRVMQRRDLDAPVVDQFGMGFIEPAILLGLIEQERARIRRRKRNLDG